jgi:hypothetical protein
MKFVSDDGRGGVLVPSTYAAEIIFRTSHPGLETHLRQPMLDWRSRFWAWLGKRSKDQQLVWRSEAVCDTPEFIEWKLANGYRDEVQRYNPKPLPIWPFVWYWLVSEVTFFIHPDWR